MPGRTMAALGTGLVGSAAATGIFLALERVLANTALSIALACALGFLVIGIGLTLVFRKVAIDLAHLQSILRAVGLERLWVRQDQVPSADAVIDKACSSVDFMGISARTLFEGKDFETTLTRKSRENSVAFRFLLFNPDSPSLPAAAQAEGANPEAWKADIEASIARLRKLKGEVGSAAVSIRSYPSAPVWRFLSVDRGVAYVSLYPRGVRGKESPAILLRQARHGFFEGFQRTFDLLWESPEAVEYDATA